jgi:hypothetical protein
MKHLLSYRFFVPPVLGFAFGLFWADADWWHKSNGVREWVEAVPMLHTIMGYFHLPAMLLFYGCVYMHIGPSGDAGWIMLVYCIIAQWTIIGLIIGFLVARRYARKKLNA